MATSASKVVIELRFGYTLLGRLQNPATYDGQRFNVPMKDGYLASVELNGSSLNVTWKCGVSESLVKKLTAGVSRCSNLGSDSEEGEAVQTAITSGVARFVRSLKYYLAEYELKEEVAVRIQDRHWSLDGTNWKPYPTGTLTCRMSATASPMLDTLARQSFQSLLNGEDELLPYSMKYLHRAKTESDPKLRWVDATIAAELAVKEFLVRHIPTIETLLLEVPSPPLHKMYGPILMSFANEESPVKRQMQKGAERRNRLIHRPKDEELTVEEADEYVNDVELGIFHLLSILRPTDKHIQQQFGDMKERHAEN